MNPPSLAHRQAWFRLFPEGNVEFLLVTRILLIILLLALAGVQVAQRPMVLLASLTVLWCDYAIMVWWVVQMASDIRRLAPGVGRDGPIDRGYRRAGVMACLPSIALLLLFAPWPEFAFKNPMTMASATRVVWPVLGLMYLALFPAALRALRQWNAGPVLWDVLLLVPILHWPALHRQLSRFRSELQRTTAAPDHTGEAQAHSLAIPLADVTWILAVLPWVVLIIFALFRPDGAGGMGGTRSIGGILSAAVLPCGAVLMALFSIADVAAVEGVQREFTAALRNADPAASAPREMP